MDLIRGRESLFGKYAATSTMEKPARIRWDGLVSGKSWPCHVILYLELDCVAALPSAVGGDILDVGPSLGGCLLDVLMPGAG